VTHFLKYVQNKVSSPIRSPALRRVPSLLVGVLIILFVGVEVTSFSYAETSKKSVQGKRRRSSQQKSLSISSTESSFSQASLYSGRTVKEIRVEGSKKIEADAVRAKVSLKPGSIITADALRWDIQSLFSLGYFDDIEILGDDVGSGIVLIYRLKERPVVSSVQITGNEQITTKDLEAVIKVKPWSILDYNRLKEDTQLISKHYEDKGYYLAKVTYDIQTTQEGVNITYKVKDFDKVKIKKITFLGNKAFTDSQLKSVMMETREGNALSFLTSAGSFKESAFKVDLQRLTLFYLDHGYVKFTYDQPKVTLSEDKRFVYLSISVSEGDVYTIGDLKVSGDLLFSKDELLTDLNLNSHDTFSITKRNFDLQKLSEKYQDQGYAFVNVVPKMNIRDEDKIVDMDYSFEKGNLIYLGEINIHGNTKTLDKVIRRELKVSEGELYHGTHLRESRENIERLGFFAPGEVIFNTVSPKGKNDVVNLDITVKERSTGTITLGAGYGSISKFFFQTQIAESNLLGYGYNLSLSAQLSADKFQKNFNLGFTDPYFLDTKWSAGFDVYYTTTTIPSKYNTRKTGFDVRFGYPVFDYTNLFVTYKAERLSILNADSSIDQADIDADDGILSSVTWTLARDKRNNRMETTSGNYQSLSIETAGLGGDKKFIKWNANNRFYWTIVGDLVFKNSVEFGQIASINGIPTPPSERFYLGGPTSLKGYEVYSVGPTRSKISSTGNPYQEPIGGQTEFYGIFELEFPIIKEAGLKIVTFYDVGNAYTTYPGFKSLDLRQDYGFGLRWFSPIGPLRFEWGFPINKKPNENSPVFQFFIGPPF
jgi:outer membrane protein insertion porin family